MENTNRPIISVIFWMLFFGILLFSSCENRLFVDLGDDYNLSSIDGMPNIAVRYGSPDFSVAIVDQTVVQVYWNDSIIVAEQVPPLAMKEEDLDNKNVQRAYYLLRKVTGKGQNPHRLVLGPMRMSTLAIELANRNVVLEDLHEFAVPTQ